MQCCTLLHGQRSGVPGSYCTPTLRCVPFRPQTPLHCAALAGQAQVVEALCKAGAAVEGVDANKATALHCAAKKGSAAVVQALIDHGALPCLRQLLCSCSFSRMTVLSSHALSRQLASLGVAVFFCGYPNRERWPRLSLGVQVPR